LAKRKAREEIFQWRGAATVSSAFIGLIAHERKRSGARLTTETFHHRNPYAVRVQAIMRFYTQSLNHTLDFGSFGKSQNITEIATICSST
jgi:hypothetical protein